MSRKTFLNTGKTGTLLFVQVDETPAGGATCELGFCDASGNLESFMTHEARSFEEECREWAEWEWAE